MDKNSPKNGRLRKTGTIAWRLFLPFSAMRSTIALGKREIERRREDVERLKGMGSAAKQIVIDGVKGKANARDDSFDSVIRDRPEGELYVDTLYKVFLRKKRAAIVAAAFFAVMAIYTIGSGIAHGSSRELALGALSLLGTQPVFFMVALGSQLRLWQLRTHRLSKAERGGLQDFMREVRGWWWRTLDPELRFKGDAS